MPGGLSETLDDALKQIRTRPLFVMRLAVSPLQIVGATPGSFRRVGVVLGGEFEGERLSGKVLPGGNDWQIVRPDGTTTLDVRIVLETSDKALIGVTYRGVRHGPPDIIEQLERGDAPDPARYYFRIAPLFETAAPQYDWINRIVAIGTGHRPAEGPIYSLFEVL